MISPGEIHIKNNEVLKGLMERRFSPLLINIILSIAKTHGIVITESYREKKHSNDLHGTQPVRAIDLRYWCYPGTLPDEIADHINSLWIYDTARPQMKVALIHDAGNGMHFHIQVGPNTRRR